MFNRNPKMQLKYVTFAEGSQSREWLWSNQEIWQRLDCPIWLTQPKEPADINLRWQYLQTNSLELNTGNHWETSRSFANALCKISSSLAIVHLTGSPLAECCTAASGWPCWWRWGASWTTTWSPRGRRASEWKTKQCKATHKFNFHRKGHTNLVDVLVAQRCFDDDGLTGGCHAGGVLHANGWKQCKRADCWNLQSLTKVWSGFPHQDQAPPLSLQGSDHAEHREQQAADLHHVHDGQRGAGQQLRGEEGDEEECLKQITVLILQSEQRGEQPIGRPLEAGENMILWLWMWLQEGSGGQGLRRDGPPEDNSLFRPRTPQWADVWQRDGLSQERFIYLYFQMAEDQTAIMVSPQFSLKKTLSVNSSSIQ